MVGPISTDRLYFFYVNTSGGVKEIREIKEIKEIKELSLNSLKSLNSLNSLNSPLSPRSFSSIYASVFCYSKNIS